MARSMAHHHTSATKHPYVHAAPMGVTTGPNDRALSIVRSGAP